MIGRILSTELRRSSAPVAGLLVAALGVTGLYILATTEQSALWDAQWSMLAGFQRVMLVLLWPVALGVGAWQARRDRRTRMEELLVTVARPDWRRALPAAVAIALFLVLGYAVIFAAGAVRVAGLAGFFSPDWLPVFAVGALSLVAAGWAGMGIGRLAPSAYTPPVLVVLGFILLVVPIELAKHSSGTAIALLAPNLTSTLDEFSTISSSVSEAQAIWFTGLALGGLVLVMFARRRTAVTALLPVVLAGVIAVPLLGTAPASGIQNDPVALAEVCTTDGGPMVCVTAAHQNGLTELVGPARKALGLMAKLPNPPTSVHEVLAARPGPQPADQIWLNSENYSPGRGWLNSEPDELLARILAGAGTRSCGDDEYRTRAITAAWLYGQYPAPLGYTVFGQEKPERDAVWNALHALPLDEQTRRIAAVRSIGLACQGDVTAALNGATS